MDVTIVAIPSEREPVWKYSSEKVPHTTLLYLGKDVTNLSQVIGYIEHVCSSVMPFGMSVEDRGTLGPDNADVLFFAKDKHGHSTVSRLRQYLLDNENIKKAYESVDQYPEWTPHLTMGYPATPAKPDERDYPGFGWIEFDRIAIWTDDYSGPEFKLKYPELEEVSMVMSDNLDALLEHHGVKGMKWGVRNDRGHEGQRATNKKIAKLDKKYEKATAAKYFAVYNAMADRMNSTEISRINNDPRFKDKDMTDLSAPLTKAYHKEYYDTATRILNESSTKILGTNASGTKKWQWNYDGTSMPTAEIVNVDKVEHADGGIPVKISWDSKGYITKIEIPNDLEQSEMVNDFLEHFGVKGMKWGVRNDRGHEGERATNKKIAKLDRQFSRKSQSLSVTFNIHNKAAVKFNSEDLERINSKYKAAAERGELLKETPTRQKYTKEIQDAFIKRLQEAADSYGTNASGTQKYNIYERPNNAGWDVTVSEIGVKHADNSEKYHVSLKYDSQGRIVSVGDAKKESLTQSDLVESFLEHFGVKGMHWGIRKDHTPTNVSVNTDPKNFGKRIVTKGGANQPPHADAIKAAVSKQKAKTSSVDSLSNKELQELVTRLNLEQQYSRLATNQKGTLARGNAKIKEILDTKNTVDRVLSDPTVKPFVQKAVKDIFDAIRS